ncbi:PorT family protein [Reichenbachiella agarivorans]|uniref:PorT family protein n=1 Tax=Reichenbachiella agarivorans TaxID=2979464 RepID=A0ABY6CP91_9BACT|nr:porin family protein [Reichenbachiella agarivorans]UXP32332.1 PorT family protein [Reichenbachiella agarivorans]
MKNRIRLGCMAACMILTLVSVDASAQIELGVKAGLNFNSASIDAASNGGSVKDVADTRTGYHFGAYAVIALGPLALQPEAYYSVQGADIDVNGAKGAINSNYLQVPVLLRFNFLKMFNVHVGPQFGFVIKNELDANGSVEDLKNDTKSGDFSIAAGAGVDLPFNLNVNVRYVKGFTEMMDDNSASGVESMKNAMFQVSIGYALLGR